MICKRCGLYPRYRERTICKNCHNEESRIRMNNLNRRMSEEEYYEQVEFQGGLCAICEQPEMATRNGKIKELSSDHCHKIGHVRELLCNNCNTAIGLMKDNPERLESAARYLRKHEIWSKL